MVPTGQIEDKISFGHHLLDDDHGCRIRVSLHPVGSVCKLQQVNRLLEGGSPTGKEGEESLYGLRYGVL